MNIFKRFSNKELIGIDIGEESIKLVEGCYDFSKMHIKRFSSIKTPYGSFLNGNIVNTEAIGKAIEEEIREKGYISNKLSFTVDNSEIVDRYIELPVTDKKQIQKMLEYEIPEQMPISLTENIVQYRIVDQISGKDSKKTKLLVVSINRSTVKSYMHLAELLKKTPYSLDTDFDGLDKILCRKILMNNSDNFTEETVAFLDIGHSTINVNLYRNAKYEFNKIIELGSKHLDGSIANFFKVDMKAAKEQKETLLDLSETSHEDESAEKILCTIAKSTVDKWASEINKVFKYFISREFGNRIDSIYIYGGGSNIKGLDRYLKDYFEIETSRIKDISCVSNESGSKLPIDIYLNALTALIRLG